MSHFLTPDQFQRLRQTRNADKALLALCLEPNVDLFEAFSSPFFSGKKTSSTNRREKQLARREIFHQIGNSGFKKSGRHKIDASKKYSYLDFALHLQSYSPRWRDTSLDDVVSLVLLLDQDMRGYIDERTIFDFCDIIDNTRAMDRSNPHRITQTLLIHLIDHFHEQSGTATLDLDIKEAFQKFTFYIRHKHKPSVMILSQYLQAKESLSEGDEFDAINDFWMQQFDTYKLPPTPQYQPSSYTDQTPADFQHAVKSPPKVLESLLQTLTVRILVFLSNKSFLN